MYRVASLTLLLLLFVSGRNSTTINFQNNCAESLWLGVTPVFVGLGIFELPPGTLTITMSDGDWRGKFWVRTQCALNNTNLQFECVTGDCHSGVIECQGASPDHPVTYLEFLGNSSTIIYDVNLIYGFNIPVRIDPVGKSNPCPTASCLADINSVCPPELRVTNADGKTVACHSQCSKFGDPKYCCTAEYSSREGCKPSDSSMLFKKQCPTANTYLYDDSTGVFSCATSNTAKFDVTFCP